MGIALEGICKSYGSTPVLGGIDLEVTEGEFLTLVGPSGCGKSTLLRIMAGLEAPDAGRVFLRGRDVTGARAADRDLAMVFQSYALYPHLTVRENMMTPLVLRELSGAGRLPLIGSLVSRGARRALMRQVEEVAEILRIESLLDRKPGQLSGGQRQRAALGRAMVRKPAAFLMDEPLSNLDAALRVHMRAELTELHRRLGRTFVYVTHDQAEALTMSTRMAVMKDGRILQLAPPAEIYARPATLEVAEFVGSPRINRLAAEIDADGFVCMDGDPVGLRLTPGRPAPVTLGVRPEGLSPVAESGVGTLSGRLGHVENLGADAFLHLDRDGVPLVLRADPARALGLRRGQTVHAAFIGAPLLFGPDGARIDALQAMEAA
ncbi:MAG: ABC transporter ATP-binding protein [Pseudomonadota bacterium]